MGQGNYQPPPQQQQAPPPQQQPPPPQYQQAPPPGYYPPQHVGRRMEHADIVHRFVAILIDGILLAIIVGIMYAIVIVGGLMDMDVSDPNSLNVGMFSGAIIVVTILSYVIMLLYFVVMEGGPNGATIGKKVMKLKVVDEQYRDIDMGKAFIRNILRWIPYLSYLIFILDVIMILVRDDNQSLRDIMAHCYVVKVPQHAQQGYMPPPPQGQYQPPPPQQKAPPPPPQQGQQQQPPQY